MALHRAQVAARRGDMDGVRVGLLAGGVLAARLPGRPAPGLAAARSTPGYFLATNPANSFFYLLTAVHGLHVLGGLVALGRTDGQGSGAAASRSRCA